MRSSTSHSSDRRSLLAGLGALGLATLLPATAQAQAPLRPIRGIVVNVGPMLDRGMGSFADRVSVLLARDMAREFAGRLSPRDRSAPLLVVTVRGISLNGFSGPSGGHGGGRDGDASTDYLDGLLTIGGDTQTLLVTQSAGGSAGRFGVESDEARRVEALTRATAYWARRRVGG